MKYYNILNLTFSQIEVFLCTAESSSFSAAALKLNYTQSMISKTIATLEKELGLMLFLRGKNSNVLTPAGKILYKDWKNIFGQVESSIEKAHLAQTGYYSTLSMGSVDTLIECSELINAIQKFSCKYPGVELKYDEYTMSELRELAKYQKLDIIVTVKHDESTMKEYGYTCKTILNSYITIFVHKSNPIYDRESIKLSDLHAESFIVLSPTSDPNYIKLLNKLCESYGFTPKISTYVSSAHSFEMNLLKGSGIVLADNYTNIHHKDIKKFVLEDVRADEILAWADNTDINTKNFISILDEFIYSQQE